jgi:hypothetical protein
MADLATSSADTSPERMRSARAVASSSPMASSRKQWKGPWCLDCMADSGLISSAYDNAPENVMACHFGYRVTSYVETAELVIDPDHS